MAQAIRIIINAPSKISMTNYLRQERAGSLAKPGAFQKALCLEKRTTALALSQHSTKIIEDEAAQIAARTLLVYKAGFNAAQTIGGRFKMESGSAIYEKLAGLGQPGAMKQRRGQPPAIGTFSLGGLTPAFSLDPPVVFVPKMSFLCPRVAPNKLA